MKHKITLQLIELEDNNFHLIVPVIFPENEKHYWIIDTGASKTVFDLNLKHLYESEGEGYNQIHTAGIGEKPIQTSIAELKPFNLQKIHVKKLKVALLDLSHINNFYSGAANLNICGLLGSDFLLDYNAIINYRAKTLTLKL